MRNAALANLVKIARKTGRLYMSQDVYDTIREYQQSERGTPELDGILLIVCSQLEPGTILTCDAPQDYPHSC